MSVLSVTVGIEVAKAHVDVFVPGAESDARRLRHDAEGHSALAAALQPLEVGLVVMASPGGYEAALASALQAAKSPVAVANPRQARGFVQSMGAWPRPLRWLLRACWPSWARCRRAAAPPTSRASCIRWPLWSRAGADCWP